MKAWTVLLIVCNLCHEGRTGLFSWCVISWFYLPWNVNIRNYSSWSVTWRFSVTREELELLTDIHDFISLFYVVLRRMVRVVFREWLRYSICNMAPCLSLSRFRFLQLLFPTWEKIIKKNILYLTCVICDPQFFPFVNRDRDPPVRPSVVTATGWQSTKQL